MSLLKIVGAVGLILISIGVVVKNRRAQDVLYIIGGICLEAYSIYIQDAIFITLQLVFISSAIYDLFKVSNSG